MSENMTELEAAKARIAELETVLRPFSDSYEQALNDSVVAFAHGCDHQVNHEDVEWDAPIKCFRAAYVALQSPIRTEHVFPPIPIRNFDWRAYRDGYEPGAILGTGKTENEAVMDLLEQEGFPCTKHS